MLLTVLLPLAAQDQPAAAPASAQTSSPSTAPAPRPKKPAPDYPDPRTITFGAYYWYLIPGSGPNIQGGKAAAAPYESLFGLGAYKPGLAVEFSMPVTRTGEIHLSGFDAKGEGTQTAPLNTTVYSVSFNKGDFLSNHYNIEGAKIYYEDLLFPYKFPVSKFRLRSIYEFQWIEIAGVVDAPLKMVSTDSSGNTTVTTGMGQEQILLPSFGIAAEYALTPHILLRAAGTAFGLPHRSEIWNTEDTVSWRRGKTEVVGGLKILHLKTSPQRDEYITTTLDGAFVGVRWHF